MSAWTKSKQEEDAVTEWGKGSLFCLAKGQTLHSKILLSLQELKAGTMFFIKASLCEEGWPNLQCHNLKTSFVGIEEQEWTLLAEKWEDNLDKTSETDLGKATWVEFYKV
mgnify:CR=1 FL=1